MKRFLLAPALLAALAAALLPGCGGGSSETQVAFVSNNTAEFWTIARAGAVKAEKELADAGTPVKLHFRTTDGGTAAKQKEIIDTLLAQGVKAVAVSVIDPPNQRAFLDKIADEAKLITVDNDAPDTKRICYLGTDNYEAGKAVGELVKKAMPQGGTIAIFVGQITALNAQQRRQGVLDALAGKKDARGETYGKYKLHGIGAEFGPFTDGADRKKAKENADDVLVKLQNEKDLCLVGLWAYNPPTIYQAVKAKELQGKVRIVGFDEDEETLRGIKEGHIYGTVVQQPFEFGYQSVKMMAALAHGDDSGVPKGGLMPIPHRVVTRDSVEAFHSELNRLMGK